jgi:hypothetical protein
MTILSSGMAVELVWRNEIVCRSRLQPQACRTASCHADSITPPLLEVPIGLR